MEDATSSESHLISAAAYVEAGVQDACDDACSICLEVFSESEPSAMTTCKHEFHLQCILEWCQRSSQCPMCWQPISLKDPESQELLDAVEHERHIMSNPPRTVFCHPTLGEFEIPVGVTDAELEERIIQHLAAAAMRRGRRIVRREGQRSRPSAHGHPHFMLSSSPNTSPASHAPHSSPSSNGGESEYTPIIAHSSVMSGENLTVFANSSRPDQVSTPSPGSGGIHIDETGLSNRGSPLRLSPSCQDREGPSEGQSFSETLKSRFTAVSSKYKESISKSTRGWKERLFSRNTSVADLGSEVKREVNVGIANVTRMMDRLGTKDNETTTSTASVSHSTEDESIQNLRNPQQAVETTGTAGVNGTHLPSPCAPSSV